MEKRDNDQRMILDEKEGEEMHNQIIERIKIRVKKYSTTSRQEVNEDTI